MKTPIPLSKNFSFLFIVTLLSFIFISLIKAREKLTFKTQNFSQKTSVSSNKNIASLQTLISDNDWTEPINQELNKINKLFGKNLK
jgi:hypothetical protein